MRKMNKKYVSVEDVRRICLAVIANYDLYDKTQGYCIEAINMAAEEIEKTAIEDLEERKKGEWNVRIFGRDGTDTYCSVCGKGGNRPYWNYCPNCGAKMRTTHND